MRSQVCQFCKVQAAFSAFKSSLHIPNRYFIPPFCARCRATRRQLFFHNACQKPPMKLQRIPALLLAAALSAQAAPPQKAELPRYPAPKNLDFAQVAGSLHTINVNGQSVPYRAFEHIVYVMKPADTRYQIMNVYIPEAYFQGGSINGFTKDTAPIFFPNNVGGYMPGEAGQPETDSRDNGKPSGPNAIAVALSQGYVVASPGARGRTEANGRAPAAIVDLKAAVRYLKANDAKMAGDARKIISNGTSAGGALSALLGTSGNAREYAPYLRALGAANATDDVFAVSAYCPITNLEHADAAYEWQFNGVNDYEKIDISMLDYHVQRKTVRGTQTAEQMRLSDGLKNLFPAYVNSLKLKNAQGVAMTLDNNGNGSFKAQIESMLAQSAQKALDEGKDLSGQTWLTIENGKIKAADFSAYAKFVGRQKTAPAFDGVDLSTGENNLFGDAQTQAKHFTAFGAQNNTVPGAQTADAATVRIMNAMNFIKRGGTQHYRIRVGETDRDTSLAISQLLALKLQAHGKNVDYALPWGVGHSGDYDLDELFAWMKDVSTRK